MSTDIRFIYVFIFFVVHDFFVCYFRNVEDSVASLEDDDPFGIVQSMEDCSMYRPSNQSMSTYLQEKSVNQRLGKNIFIIFCHVSYVFLH